MEDLFQNAYERKTLEQPIVLEMEEYLFSWALKKSIKNKQKKKVTSKLN